MKVNKRLISVLIPIVLLVMIAAGVIIYNMCNVEYTAQQVGTSEFPLWDSSKTRDHQDKSAPKEATVTFNGKTYSGEYDCSIINVPNLYTSHKYKGDNFYFEINGKTGELSSIYFLDASFGGNAISKEKCKEIADLIADDYIDLSEYKVEEYKYGSAYSFDYFREVNGYKTVDRLTVGVEENGNVAVFGKYTLGSFENVDTIKIDEEKAKKVIEAKLKSIYKDKIDLDDYSVDNFILLKHDHDNIALLYTISFKYKTDIKNGETVKLLLTIK
ncbi:MAG: hypothetical protein E7593_05195 [Ruminococcaceae bacterium]|nr:hypothetical protein [Oscillospiraceae bacterium]